MSDPYRVDTLIMIISIWISHIVYNRESVFLVVPDTQTVLYTQLYTKSAVSPTNLGLYAMLNRALVYCLSQDPCPDAVQQCWRVSCSPCVSCRHCWPCSCQTTSHNSATFNKTETQQTTLNHCSLETLTTASTTLPYNYVVMLEIFKK